MDAVGVVLGAGRGERLGGGGPKALCEIEGRTLLEWSARALGAARGVGSVLCVVPAGFEGTAFAGLRERWNGPAHLEAPVAGGDTRQRSLGNALRALAAREVDAEWVLVHDAARCCVQPGDAEAVLAAARETGAAIPVVPLADTVKRVLRGSVAETLPREALAAAQTPQGFRLAILREALEKAERDGFAGTDCASLVERLGVPVRTCAGRAENFKVTDARDLERARTLLLGNAPA